MQLQTLCTVSELPERGGLEVEVMTAEGPCSVAVFRVGADVRAYRNVCPHLGRNFDYAPGEFLLSQRGELVCPHHGASFDLASGLCLQGPCRGESLRPVPVEVRDGVVWIEGRR